VAITLVSTPGPVGVGMTVWFQSSLAVVGDLGRVSVHAVSGATREQCVGQADFFGVPDCFCVLGYSSRAIGSGLYLPAMNEGGLALGAPVAVDCTVYHGSTVVETATFSLVWTHDPLSGAHVLFEFIGINVHDPVLDQILIAVTGYLPTLP